MLVRAYLVCSDGDCEFTLDAVGTPAELETLCCDCGYGLEQIGWPDEVLSG
jgi:hypothetical protein